MPVPAKAIPVADVRAKAGTSFRNLLFVFRVMDCPAEWESDGKPGHSPKQKTDVSLTITCPTSASMEVNFYTSTPTTPGRALVVASDVSSPTWQGTATDDEYSNAVSYKSKHAWGETRYVTVKVQYLRDDVASAVGYIYSMSFESVLGSDDYSGEIDDTERTGTDRLYIPDRSCSSWHMMKATIETMNKFLSEQRTFYNVPVIDYWVV
jgi:hypothetical protein